MKKLILTLAIVGLSLSIPVKADAFLIGDMITLQHSSPTQGTTGFPGNAIRTVEAGVGDLWTASFGALDVYTVNPEASTIEVDFIGTNSWFTQSFNGLEVFDIDATLAALFIDTNLAGWDDSRASFTDHTASFNWSGLSWQDDSFFTARLATSAVPEPMSMMLFGSGLVGAAIRKRFNV